MAKQFSKAKALLSITLVLCMLAVMLPAGIGSLLVSATDVPVWDGSEIDGDIAGDGSEGNPYQITSGAELAFVAQQVNAQDTTYNAAHYKLMCDIDLGGHQWTPIGQMASNNFMGTFDGGDHTITNLSYNNTANNANIGLFGYVYRATIYDLHIENASLTTTTASFVGGIAGQAGDNSTFTNCSFGGTITISSTSNKMIGGLVGNIVGANVALTKCWSTGAVTRPSTCIAQLGGIFGQLATGTSSATLTNCYSTMTLLTNSTNLFDHTSASSNCGGLFGNGGTGSLTLINCYFAGKLTKNRPYPIGQTAAATSSYLNVFYRADWPTTAVTAAGAGITDVTGGAVERSVEEFADGTVTALLNTSENPDIANAWMQGEAYPIHAHEAPALSALVVYGETIAIKDGVLVYNLANDVEHDVDRVSVVATPAQDSATVKVKANGNEVADSSATTLGIPGATTAITIEVTYRTLTTTYTVNVYRKPAPWDGITVEGFADGDGTTGNPYQITNGAQLAFMAQKITNENSTYRALSYKVMCDIDLNGKPWTRIGEVSSTSFRGTFDGDNHTITGFNYEHTLGANTYGGLFGYVTSGTIKNVHVKDATVSVNQGYVGGLVGRADNITLINCSFDGEFSNYNGEQNRNVGGLVGAIYGTVSFTNCSSTGSVTFTKGYTGGIFAREFNNTGLTSVTLTNCYSTMAFSVTSSYGPCGGLFSKTSTGSLTLTNCYFAGELTSAHPNPIGTTVTTGTKTYTNVYYSKGSIPEDTTAAGAGIGDANVMEKSVAEFADGTVTKALGTANWATSTAGYPVISDLGATYDAAFVLYSPSIRVAAPYQGIRFKFDMAQSAQTDMLNKYGILVAKESDATKKTNGLLYLNPGYTTEEAVAYEKDVKPEKLVGSADGYDTFATVVYTDTDKYMADKITTQYERPYIVRAYALYTDSLGQELVVYSDLIDSKTESENEEKNLNSVCGIATYFKKYPQGLGENYMSYIEQVFSYSSNNDAYKLNNTYYKLNGLGTKTYFNVAYLGGSITAGTGASTGCSWREKTTAWLREEYTTVGNGKLANVYERNVAIGNTGSNFGAYRALDDLKLSGSNPPDLVFIEFSVNDSLQSSWYATNTGFHSYQEYLEYIINTIYENAPYADIVMVLTTTASRASGTAAFPEKDVHIKVAKAYGIPYIDVGEALKDEVIDVYGELSLENCENYFGDGTHPNNDGYAVYAACIQERLESILNKEVAPTGLVESYNPKMTLATELPESPYMDNLAGETAPTGVTILENAISNQGVTAGSFAFAEVNAKLTFTFTGTDLMLWLKNGVTFTADTIQSGTLHVLVKDGEQTVYEASGVDFRATNNALLPIVNGLSNVEHTVTITLEEITSGETVSDVYVRNFLISGDPDMRGITVVE